MNRATGKALELWQDAVLLIEQNYSVLSLVMNGTAYLLSYQRVIDDFGGGLDFTSSTINNILKPVQDRIAKLLYAADAIEYDEAAIQVYPDFSDFDVVAINRAEGGTVDGLGQWQLHIPLIVKAGVSVLITGVIAYVSKLVTDSEVAQNEIVKKRLEMIDYVNTLPADQQKQAIEAFKAIDSGEDQDFLDRVGSGFKSGVIHLGGLVAIALTGIALIMALRK